MSEFEPPTGETAGRRYAIPEAPPGRGFGATSLWTILGTIIPGVGLIAAGRRLAGSIILGALVLGVAGLGIYLYLNPQQLGSALDPAVLTGIAIGLLVLGLLWVGVIVSTFLSLRRPPTGWAERLLGSALVGVLSFAVAAPLAVAANTAYITADAINSTFGDDDPGTGVATGADPWADTPRLNILILGGDSGVKSGRSKAIGTRTDTVVVASIDTATGATTLITLPRNAEQMPFPADSPLHKYYPNGFYQPGADGAERAEYLLNAMYRNVPARVPNDILGKTKDFGASVMMESVGEALGLDINYYVFVNMDGFKDFINAIGGITVNVNYAVPIGGHNASGAEPELKPRGWIEPGPDQHFMGLKAIWFARGRYHLDDYSRMERQRCVIYAVTKQTTPSVVLSNYQSIVKTGADNISTNIPKKMLAPMVELGLKVKDQKSRSLVLDPSNGFLSYDPNWPAVRKKVKKALKESGDTEESASPSASASASASGSASPSPTATKKAKKKSEDLAQVCSYHPEDYKETVR